MRHRNHIVAVVIAVLSLMPSAPSAADGRYDEQYELVYPTNPDPRNVASYGMLAEAIPQNKPSPALLGFEAEGTDRQHSLITGVGLCALMDDLPCKDAEYVQYDALLPYCSTDVITDCIAGISAADASGKPLQVTVVDRFVVPGYDHAGSAALQLPTGREAVLFTVAGVTHPGGNLFMAYANLAGDKLAADAKFRVSQFRARIAAVNLENRSGRAPRVATTMSGYVNAIIGRRSGDGSTDNCVLRTDTVCAVPYPMPLDLGFGMTLKLATQLNGWLHGRFSEPTASVTVSGGVQTVTFQAKPVQVPSAVGWIMKSDIPADLGAFYASQQFVGGMGIGCTAADPKDCGSPNTWLSVLRSLWPDETSMREFTMWLRSLGDKAIAVPSVWLVQNTSSGPDRTNCYQATDKLSGIVMTNATSYIAGPPSFNAETQSLDYTVAAPHFMPDGLTPFRGTYDLLIRSDVARCIYGFSNAPISATLSVISESGENEVATTVVNERDGWLTLRAAGFSFSNPTVRVKLTQAPAASKPLEVKKTSITCVKGKSVKKVVATKCPAGYKKK